MNVIDWIRQPWPWYVAGPLIGLTVPTLLLLGNKSFGISSSLRHLCAACFPANLSFFQYDWKQQIWNLYFVLGIGLGGFVASYFLTNPAPLILAPNTKVALQALSIHDFSGLIPQELFGLAQVFSWKGVIFLVGGGFLVGFGTRWAGGCTSGHAIMGLSTLQWPSLVATGCFMIGGFAATHWLLPTLIKLILQP